MTEEAVVEQIEEEVVEEVVDELTPEEIELGKQHGLIEEQEEVKEDLDEVKPEDVPDEAAKNEQEIILEKIEKGEELTPEEDNVMKKEQDVEKRAFYFKYKAEKQRRQTIAKEKELAQVKVKASDVRIKELEEKLKKIEDGEFEEEDLTQEQLLAKAKEELKREQEPSKVQELDLEYKKSLLEELSLSEKARKPEYEVIEQEFMKIISQNPQIQNMVLDKIERYDGSSLASKDLINFTYAVVEDSGFKLQPKVDKNAEDKTNRMIKNSTKPKSTASISTGSAHTKTFEEIEATDVLNMSDKDWREMPEDKREALMRKYG